MQPRLIIQQKLTAFVNKYNVYDAKADGSLDQLVAMAQQKRLAFKEKVLFYADEKRDRVMFTFRAEKVLDVHGRYFVEDQNGKLLGMFKKEFVSSLIRSTWKLLDVSGEERYEIRESNQVLAIVRRFGLEVPILGQLVDLITTLFRYHFDFVDSKTGQIVGKYIKTTLVRDHYVLYADEKLWREIDWRVLASVGVALDALQSR